MSIVYFCIQHRPVEAIMQYEYVHKYSTSFQLQRSFLPRKLSTLGAGSGASDMVGVDALTVEGKIVARDASGDLANVACANGSTRSSVPLPFPLDCFCSLLNWKFGSARAKAFLRKLYAINKRKLSAWFCKSCYEQR